MTLSRREAEELLPFLANDTLGDDERRAVEQAVASDPTLAVELAALRQIRQTMQSQQAVHSPGEFGLARLMRDVEKEQAPARSVVTDTSRPRLLQIAAAVLVAIVIGQAVLLSGRADETGGFELAGGEAATLNVAFVPDATEATIRALLQQAGVEIVSGPSALGLYGLNVIEGTTPSAAQEVLRAADDVVESVDRTD